MADNRKSTITAKVAEQIVEYYQMALKALDMGNASNVLGSRQLKVGFKFHVVLLTILYSHFQKQYYVLEGP